MSEWTFKWILYINNIFNLKLCNFSFNFFVILFIYIHKLYHYLAIFVLHLEKQWLLLLHYLQYHWVTLLPIEKLNPNFPQKIVVPSNMDCLKDIRTQEEQGALKLNVGQGLAEIVSFVSISHTFQVNWHTNAFLTITVETKLVDAILDIIGAKIV